MIKPLWSILIIIFSINCGYFHYWFFCLCLTFIFFVFNLTFRLDFWSIFIEIRRSAWSYRIIWNACDFMNIAIRYIAGLWLGSFCLRCLGGSIKVENAIKPILKSRKHLILKFKQLLWAHIANNIPISLNNIVATIDPIIVSNHLVDIAIDFVHIADPSIVLTFDLIIDSKPLIAVPIVFKNEITIGWCKEKNCEGVEWF